MTRQKKWDFRFLLEAKNIAEEWSKDPSTKVGAVIANADCEIVSIGFNGFPRRVDDTPERYADRDFKNLVVVHAEINSIIFAKRDLRGCCLYVWPFMPCSRCAGPVIQSGISRVVAPYSDNPRWVDNFQYSKMMFAEAGVELVIYQTEEILANG